MNTEILQQLNESQRRAVEYCDGASLVIAGAGSGKTRVLTYKIAWLMELGMAPWEILALTFTNKAAREMKERIGQLVGHERARYLQMGTFHSVFARILRAEAQHIGYQSNFTIYDETDSRSLLKTIIKELDQRVKAKYKDAKVQNATAINHQRIRRVDGEEPPDAASGLCGECLGQGRRHPETAAGGEYLYKVRRTVQTGQCDGLR